MNFNYTEEQLMIKQAAKDFARSELLPGVIERDNNAQFPAEQVKKMAELGFLGMMVDPKYDGTGMDSISYVLAMEEISKIDSSASVIMSVNNSLVCWGLEKYGSEEQKQKYLKPLARGEIIGAFALSEPEAGSDATSQRTTAIDKGDYYLLNGTKNWITSGKNASVYLVMAQSDVEKRHKGINAFIVEKGMKGFEAGPKEDKMGMRGSDTCSLMFTVCSAFWDQTNLKQLLKPMKKLTLVTIFEFCLQLCRLCQLFLDKIWAAGFGGGGRRGEFVFVAIVGVAWRCWCNCLALAALHTRAIVVLGAGGE